MHKKEELMIREEIEKIVGLNSTILLSAKGDKFNLQVYQQSIEGPLPKNDDIPDVHEVLAIHHGKRVCLVSSDVYDVMNEKIKIRNLETHNLHNILITSLMGALPWLTNKSKEYSNPILIQSSYSTDNPSLTVMAGFVDDAQVLLLDIHYERNERSYTC